MCKKTKGIICTVGEIENEEFIKLNIDYERYVFVNSMAIKPVYGSKFKDTHSTNILEGFVQITNNKKSIYRKVIGGPIKENAIQMGYRTRCELGVEANVEVRITPVHWFCYYWCNSETHVKQIFRITMIGFVIAIISILRQFELL